MKAQAFLAVIVSLLTFSLVGSADSDTKLPIEKELKIADQQDEATIRNVTRLVAHLSFASQALDLKMKESALRNLSRAKTLCAEIEKSRPEVISKYEYRYGKTTYTVNGIDRDYYIPVMDDAFMEGQFDDKSLWRKNPKLEEKGVSIVRTKLQLNLKSIASSIDSATKAAKEGKFEQASGALDGIFKDAMTTSEVVTNPVWTVWANLVLAKEFLHANKFKSARFALKAVQTDLERLEKDGTLVKSGEEVKKLQQELGKITHTLNEEDPSLTKKFQATLTNWAKKVKAWL